MAPLKIGNGLIYADSISLGQDIVLEDGVQIGFPDRPVAKLTLGDHIFIGHDSKLYSPLLTIQDYTKIHNHCLIYGQKPCYIGFNAWFGQHCIIDCEGSVHIGNGFGAGAQSQLWSHSRHGDLLIGSKFGHVFKPLMIEEDVWFSGSVICTPIHAHKRSMALVGSVVTQDMPENTLWGGCPARNLTDKLGQPFVEPTLDIKYQIMQGKLEQFYRANPGLPRNIEIVAEFNKSDRIQFNVVTRTYTKRNWPEEVGFMRALLPEAKFVPDAVIWR